MKKTGLIIVALALAVSSNAQENLNQLLAAGVADAERFSASYIKPANDGLAYGINTGWFNNAKTPKRFGFELSIIGNATFISEEDKQFVLDVSEYENIYKQPVFSNFDDFLEAPGTLPDLPGWILGHPIKNWKTTNEKCVKQAVFKQS